MALSFPTALQVVDQAARELGLGVVTAAFASTDPNLVQLCALLGSAGQEIVGDFMWEYLQTEYTFNTVAAQVDYPLPAGFRKMIDQSGWNRTDRFPLAGGLSSQEWQCLQATPAAQTLVVMFRARRGQMSLSPTPTSVKTIAYEYVTSFWVALTATPTVPAKDAPTLDTDVLLFPKLLLVRALKLAWKRDKGMDTTSAQQDYDDALTKAQNDDTSAPILKVGGPAGDALIGRFLDGSNVPYTGFGS